MADRHVADQRAQSVLVEHLGDQALFALQHRGQESAGIATATPGGHIMAMRDQGLVYQVFDEQKLRALQGDMAIGHVRYSTTGVLGWENAQPVCRADQRESRSRHNGNLDQRRRAARRAARARRAVPLDLRLRDHRRAALHAPGASGSRTRSPTCCRACSGAFSTVVMTEDARGRLPRSRTGCGRSRSGMIGDRRPLRTASPASRARSTSSAPSSCATSSRRVVTLDRRAGIRRARPCAGAAPRVLRLRAHLLRAARLAAWAARVLQVARGRMGEILAREAPVDADLVIPVPDSGNAAARGFARASGLPQDDGFIKNRYVARTFIQPGQELRKHGLRLKFNPLPEVVAGKRLVVVDDSIVRGNTTRQIVQMLRDAGAAEVHLRISAPPIRHPCHYGIDMSTREEMIAHGRTVERGRRRARRRLAAYLSLEGVYEAIGGARDDALRRLLLAASTRSPGPRRPGSTRSSTRSRSSAPDVALRDARSAASAARQSPGRGGMVAPSVGVHRLARAPTRRSPASGRARAGARRPRDGRRRAALRELFGFAAFRPGQREAVEAALAGRDVLVVMPTGSGKSLCYQLPALMRTDLTLVVSPLVSLMQDQVEALERVAPGRRRRWSTPSRTRAANRRGAGARRRAGELRLLYVAPERFASPGFLERSAQRRVGLFVVDEAHCVSQWGHDFRPDYFRLADAARWLGARAILASTATATPQVAADIVGAARAARPGRGSRPGSTARTSRFAVVPCANQGDRRPRASPRRWRKPGALPAIVYAGTRDGLRALARALGARARR